MNATQVIELYEVLPKEQQRIVAEHIRKHAMTHETEPKPPEEFKNLVNQLCDKHSDLMKRLAL